LQSEGFNWTERDFELGKEVALYTIELLKQRIKGERIAIIKNLVEFLKQKVPDKSSNITKGIVGGLLHVPGFFSRIGFDARITTWSNKDPDVAIWELDTVKENILNLKNYDERLNLNFGKIRELQKKPPNNIVEKIIDKQDERKMQKRKVKHSMKVFNWKGTDFDIGKEAAIFTIEILKRKIAGEQISINDSLINFLKNRVPDKRDDITVGIVAGLTHITGFFPRIGLDARITTWLDKDPQKAIAELDILKQELMDLKNYDESSKLKLERLNSRQKQENNNSKNNTEEIDEEEEELEELKDFERVTKNYIYIEDTDFQVRYLIDDLKSNDIYVPDFQRYFVWNYSKASRLVESILLGFPIPLIYLSEDLDGRRQIIDGQQRLFSILKFYDNDYSLKLGSKNKLTRKRFKDLPKNLQRAFRNYTLKVVTLKKNSNPAVKYEMFERLNRGSTILNDQEIRNCMYRGKYMDSIKRMARYPEFVNAANYKKFKTRMQMEDIVTRFGALIHNNYRISFKGSMKNFLQKEMEDHLNPSDGFITDFETAFKKCAYLAFSIFGGNAYKRYIIKKDKTSAKWDKTINKSLFEAIMYCLAQYDKNQIMHHKDQIYEGTLSLMANNERFNDLISHHTNNKDRYLERMEIMKNLFHSIITTPKQHRCFSYELKKDLYDKNDICTICGQQIIDIRDADVDHIKEYWKGGLTIPENARLVHRWCNLKRTKNY